MDLNVKDKAKLTKAAEGRNSEQGCIFAKLGDYKALIEAGLVEADETNKQGVNVAIRATDAGMESAGIAINGSGALGDPAGETGETGEETGEEATEELSTSSGFEVEDDIPVPTIVRRPEGSKYPFDRMEIGQSFHVPKTAEMPNPVKSLASSVSAANRAAATDLEGTHKTRRGNYVGNYRLNKKFVVRPASKDDKKGPGARVWRVELPENPVVDGSGGEDE